MFTERTIKIKPLSENATMPTQGSEQAAGWDLYAAEDAEIPSGECVKIPTNIATEMPPGMFGAIFPRSGLATKQGLRLANCVAVIDADYRGEWLVPMYNDSDTTRVIHKSDRIAQVVFLPCLPVTFYKTNDLGDTERGSGGFGHSGV